MGGALVPQLGKAFLIASAAPSEGKTTVVANLAAAVAQGESKIIAVESEIRRLLLASPTALTRSLF